MIATPMIATDNIILREEQRMIRPLRQTDYMVTKRLFQEAFAMSEEPYFVAAWSSRDPASTLGFWNKDVLVGAAIVSDNRLEYIFMHDEYRGDGTGTQLLNAVIAKCPNIHLTPVDDPAIKAWYRRNGFHMATQKGEYELYVRHTHNTRTNPRLHT
jgi:GNAT superfamily N-acetyltransferase